MNNRRRAKMRRTGQERIEEIKDDREEEGEEGQMEEIEPFHDESKS